jgi:hypothetical protein
VTKLNYLLEMLTAMCVEVVEVTVLRVSTACTLVVTVFYQTADSAFLHNVDKDLPG